MNVLKTPKCVKKTKVFKYNMAKRSREQKGNSMKMEKSENSESTVNKRKKDLLAIF